jgi:hypothetical protein
VDDEVDPTAVHASIEMHDTSQKTLLETYPGGVGGFGAGWIVHVLPFQSSTSTLKSASPTAVHVVLDTHEIPYRAV